MKIEKIKYGLEMTVNLGNYENAKISLTVSAISENETFNELKEKVYELVSEEIHNKYFQYKKLNTGGK